MYTIHRREQDRHYQQFCTPPVQIIAPQWLHRPCNASMWLYRVDKKPSVKADLAVYSHVVDVSGQCMSMNVSLIIGFTLDFSSCADWDGFCKYSLI